MKKKTTKGNWAKEETLAYIKNKAEKTAKKHELYEREMAGKGYKKVMVDHPTQVRCKVVKWVKIKA